MQALKYSSIFDVGYLSWHLSSDNWGRSPTTHHQRI